MKVLTMLTVVINALVQKEEMVTVIACMLTVIMCSVNRKLFPCTYHPFNTGGCFCFPGHIS